MKKTVYSSLITKIINISNKGLLFTSLILSSILSNAQTTVTFTTPGATTWTVPDCVSSITVQVWSGGGGGGGSISILRNSSDGEACSGGGGGGGGGYTSQTFAVTSGQVYNLVVGAGGIAGTPGAGTWNGGITTPPGVGGTGGTSSFMNFGINLVATGGIGGNGAGAYNNNNPPDVNAVGTGGAGGVGSGGTVFYNGGSGAAGYILWTGTDKSGGGGGAAGPGGAGANAPAGNSYGIIDNNPGGLGSAPGGTGGNSRMNNLPSNTSKNGGNGNLIGAGGGGGLNHKDGYGAVSASGGAGARGEIRITYTSPVLPATPTISSTAPTCSAAGSSTITNYNAAYTYNFTPAGPTVGAGGVISGMVTGTNYTVTANNGSCNSTATANFNNAPTLTVPSTPTLNSTAPSCSAAGSSTVSNYNAALTYNFTPAGPTVGAGGVISGMVVGTTYQVTASNGSCSSTNSVDFSNSAMLPSPAVPTISSSAPTCSAAGSSTISNYNGALTYNFTPAGPTVGAGGVISGMAVGTTYQVTASNGSCSSTATANFSNAPTLTTPTIPTLSSTAPTCSAAGSSTISNYNASLTYNFSPAGPTVGASGVITGMAVGTTYQVTASNGSCSSTNSVDFSNSAMLPSPAVPTISSSAPTCSAAGSSTISNYNGALTYNFTPAGPTVGAGGVISGMAVGTTYQVTASNGSCSSTATANFSNAPTLTTPTIPTLSSTAPTCSAAGSSTISNYNASLTYNFSPAGPTVGAGGVITGMAVGTTYQVTASNGSCSSTNSVDFSNSAMLPSPSTPTISSSAPTCSAAGSSTISNYNASLTYNFTPAGPTVGAGGVISGMVAGTNYTVTANNGSCSSTATANFSNADILPSPIVTASSTAVCENGVITLTPTTGGTWVSNNTGVATVTAGGIVTIISNGSVDFTFTATNTCTVTTPSVLVNPEDNASFSYTSNTHCLTGVDPVATVTGTAGGTFTITAPGVINATTGEVDLSASGLGTFTVYYNTAVAGNPCPSIDSTIINITSAPSADFSYNVSQACQDATAPILSFGVGASAGVFSSTPAGLTLNTSNGAITLSTSTPGVYTVYNTIAASGGCAAALDSTTIEVLQLDDATFNYATGGTYCLTGTDPVATVTGTAGGTFTITTPGVINATTGEVDLSASGLGTFTVYYNTPSGNACSQLDSTTINIVNAPGAAFTYATPFCQDNGTALPTFVGNNFAGTFSTNPAGVVFVSTSTGEIDLTSSTPGTYTVYNNLAASGGCAAALDSFVVTINPSFNLQETVNVCSGGSYTFPDGTTQTNITTQVVYNSNLTTTSGCDSIVETTVNVNPTFSTQETVSVCSGGSYTFPDGTTQNNITAQVVYNSNLTTTSGCDSIVETTVNINPIIFIQETVSVCSGGSYTFPDGTTQNNITAQVVYNSNLTTTSGCDSIVETTVNVDPPLSIVADPVAPICFGENLILTATGSGNGTVTWYSDAAGTNVIGTGSTFNATTQVSATGLYTFYVNEAGTCPSPLTAVNVVVGGVTAAITATPTSGFMPLAVVFDNNSSTGPTVTYNWNFGDGPPTSNITDPTHTYTNLGNYTAVLIVSDGVCSDTATVKIEVIGQSTILIPNVFTPNGDGSNDVFTVDGTNLESVEGQIFNRWGQKLYEWNSVKGSWDGRTQSGTEVPDGTYFYIINAKGMDGEEYFKTGACTLIR